MQLVLPGLVGGPGLLRPLAVRLPTKGLVAAVVESAVHLRCSCGGRGASVTLRAAAFRLPPPVGQCKQGHFCQQDCHVQFGHHNNITLALDEHQ
jgi:N-methylhydantoinase B/oxoprolinase/acetone carboxylase alpha subunit